MTRPDAVFEGTQSMQRAREWKNYEDDWQSDMPTQRWVVGVDVQNTRKFYGFETIDRLWQWYAHFPTPSQRPTVHEIIWSNAVCRYLYFDCEIDAAVDENHKHNGARDPVYMLHQLYDLIDEAARRELGVALDRSQIRIYDASGPEKVSLHVLVPLHGIVWRDQRACKAFIERCILNGANRHRFIVTKNDAARTETTFIDMAVYDTNHSIRMYGAPKHRDPTNYQRILLPPHQRHREDYTTLDRTEFLASLITWTQPPDEESADDSSSDGLIQVGGEQKYRYRRSVLFPRRQVVLPFPGGEGSKLMQALANSKITRRTINSVVFGQNCRANNELAVEHAKRLAPLVLQEEGEVLRSCTYSIETQTLTLLSTGHRCAFIDGQCHKSNNVYYVVHLSRGYFCQKCFDPDCRGKRTPPIYLPPDWGRLPFEILLTRYARRHHHHQTESVQAAKE